MSPFTAVRPSPAGPQTVKTLSARVVTTVRRQRCESHHLEYAQGTLIPFAFSHGLGRYKSLIGERLRSRGDAAWRTETAVGAAVLNRTLDAARPNSVRRSAALA